MSTTRTSRFRARVIIGWFTFGLLLIFGLLIFRMASRKYGEYQAEQFALRQLNSEGGWIITFRQYEMRGFFSSPQHSVFVTQRWCGPKFLESLLRNSEAPIFDRTIAIDLSRTTFDQDDLKAMSYLHALERVTIDSRDALPESIRKAREALPGVTFEVRQLGYLQPR
jgi:hypothetical protein